VPEGPSHAHENPRGTPVGRRIHLEDDPATVAQLVVASQVAAVHVAVEVDATVVLDPHALLLPAEVEPGHEAAPGVAHLQLRRRRR
jgi:hypothetical protein